jgi:hypothetical protein
MNGPRGAADPAVNKAAGVGEPVTQEIATTSVFIEVQYDRTTQCDATLIPGVDHMTGVK